MLRSCLLTTSCAREKHISRVRAEEQIFKVARVYSKPIDHMLYLSGVLPVAERQSEKRTAVWVSSPR